MNSMKKQKDKMDKEACHDAVHRIAVRHNRVNSHIQNYISYILQKIYVKSVYILHTYNYL